MEVYSRDVAGVSLLSREEEQSLARAFHAGDLHAGHRLVTANLRFVLKVAHEYRRHGVRFADLVQEGNLGLMRAVQKFDPDLGIRLISYAVWWIRANIQHFILTNFSLVKIGTTQVQRQLFFGLARARRELEKMDGRRGAPRRITPERLAEHLQVKRSEVEEMQARTTGHDLSLDTPLSDEAEGPSRLESLLGTQSQPEEDVGEREHHARLKADVETAAAGLDAREKFILEKRLMSDEPWTLRAIGAYLGFSRERARQLEKRTLRKVRASLLAADAVQSLSGQRRPKLEQGTKVFA